MGPRGPREQMRLTILKTLAKRGTDPLNLEDVKEAIASKLTLIFSEVSI